MLHFSNDQKILSNFSLLCVFQLCESLIVIEIILALDVTHFGLCRTICFGDDPTLSF